MRQLHWLLDVLLICACFAFLPGLQCQSKPVSPVPVDVGGSTSTGGAPATGGISAGGVSAFGGQLATGGATNAGGTTSVVTTVAALEWPTCTEQTTKLPKADVDALRRSLMPIRKQVTRKVRASYTVLDLPDTSWDQLAPTLHQGDLGSCTGNSGLQMRVSAPWVWTGSLNATVLEDLAVSIYSGATDRDPYEGAWPPDDTGSNGEAVMEEMKSRGLILDWSSPVTFEGLQRSMQLGPCSMGSNWYTSMLTPDRCGQISISGVNEGGHQTTVKGIQYATKRILFLNSWGPKWGAKRKGMGGWFWLTFGSVKRLMDEGADFKCAIVGPLR